MPLSSTSPDNLPPRLSFRVPAEPSHLLRARERLRDYLRQYCASPEAIDDCVLCVEEACTNAIRHSGAADEIEISLAFEAERLVAQVKDRGRGFDTASFDPSRNPDPSADHGRGLFIIAALMDSLELRLDGGLEVRMARAAEPRCEPQPLESGLGVARAAGERLGHREARTRAMLEEIDEAFIALDWEYRYVYANETACRLLGRSRDELLGHTPFALFQALRASDLERGFRAAMELGTSTVMEWLSPVIGVWVETRIYPTPAGVASYFRDISERKVKEEERERLIAEQRRIAQLSGALDAINSAVGARPDSTDVLQDVLRLAGEALGCDAGNLVVRDGDDWTTTHVWNMPANFVGQRFRANEVPYAALAVAQQRPIPVDDYRSDHLGSAELAERLNLGASLAIPLMVEGAGFGCLFFAYLGSPHHFGNIEIDFAQKTGATVSRALENTRLFAALRASETDYRLLAENSSDVVWVLDLESSHFRYVSPSVEQLRGYTAQEVLAQDMSAALTADSAQYLARVLPDRLAEFRSGIEQTYIDEIEQPCKDGTTVWTETSTRYVADPETGRIEVYGASRDITKRRKAQEELGAATERERFLADVVDRADFPLGIGAPDGRLIFFNQAFADLTGYSRDELEEMALTWAVDLTPPQWRAHESTLLAQAVREHRAVRYEKEYLRKDGSLVPIELLVQPIFDAEGGLLHYRSVVTDIGARKRSELERERLLATLQDRSADLNEHTASLARRVALDESLERVNRLIYSTLEFDEIMQRALDEAMAALGADAGSIEMREEESWAVRYQRGFAAPSGGLRLSNAEAPIATRAALSREPVAVEDLLDETETDVAFLRGQQLRSTLAVPLIVRGVVVGCLLFHGRAPRVFTPPEIDFGRKLGSTVSLALENARLSEHETEAGRFDESLTWSRTAKLARRLRAHPWRVLAGAIAIQSAILAALNTAHDTRHVLGLPGSMIALIAVIAGALAGPIVGALVAIAGGVVFYLTVGGHGSKSSVLTTVISTAIWVAAGLVSGYLAKGLREQAERRRAASVGLARADAARDAQLAEQARIEELAAELRAETDDLTARAAAAEALNAINALIHSTLDFDHVMQRALEQGVDAMATDVGAIELREQGSWIVRYQRGLSDAEIGRRMNDREAPCATRAASSREPFTIADLTAEGSMNVGLVASCDLRSVVSVPLIVRKEVIGCLLFYDRRPRSFSETEVDFARKLGVTVSLAVANARLFEVEQAELARVTVLQEVAVAAASSLEPARLSQNVLDRAGSLLGASKGSVYLVDPDAGVARHVALMGYSAESLPALETLPLDDLTLSGRAIMTGEVQAPDPGDVPPETVRRAGSVGMADDRLIAVPLLVRGAPVGSLGFGFPGRRPFRDHEVELYRAVADQLGAALENARLFEAEVAAERRASAELRNADLLLESAKLLAGGLDQRAILDTLAVVVLEALPHSRVTVQLWDAASRTLTIAASHGTRPAPTGTEIAFDQTSPAFRDMLEHKATVVTDFDAVPVAARGQADKYASRLHLGVPLVAGQELLGVLVVDDPGERRPFGEREIALLEAIAAQAATAIANAGVFERQRRIAQTLQENLIHPLPVVAGLELGVIAQTAYDPELVGGDFSDVFLLDDTHVVLLIADVAGKGVRAAGHTETVRSKVRALATIDPSPAFILAKTNELLLRFDPDDPHVTAFLAVLDPTTGHLTYASAGHPAAVHLGAFSCRLLDVAFGPPLGSFSRAYANAHAMLTLEDYLVLYTDGVTEARQGIEMLGSERLLEVVAGLRGRSAQEVADGVRDAALAYAGRLRDDLQVVVLRLA